MARPRVTLRPSDYPRIESLAAEGKGQASIAKRLGFSYRTFKKVLQRDDRAREAWQRGIADEEDMALESMREQCAKGYMPACTWLLERRHGYGKERLELPEGARVFIPVQLTVAEYRNSMRDVTPGRKELPEVTVQEVERA